MGAASPEEIVKTAVDCGMSAVDWVTSCQTVDAAYLGRIVRDAGLAVAAYTPAGNKFASGADGWQDEFKRLLDDAVSMQAPVMMIPPFNRTISEWTEFYRWAVPLAQEAGVILSLEAVGMPGSPITTAAETLEVINAVPGLKLTLDYGNMATAGEEPEACLPLCEHIVHIHLKDWKISDTPVPDSMTTRIGKFFSLTPVGDGDLKLKHLWDILPPHLKELYVNLEIFHRGNLPPMPEIFKRVSDDLRNW
jgi:sugar phosphate isomerase/epimerase